ncbi:MAG: hypothetical protein ACRDUY_05110 [Nitriliruptorales bacterium]
MADNPDRRLGGDPIEQLRGLMAREELTADRLAVRARWPVEQVQAVLDGSLQPTENDLAVLFACFGRRRDLTLLDDSFLDEMRDTAHLSPSERLAIAVELSRVATQLAASARPQG